MYIYELKYQQATGPHYFIDDLSNIFYIYIYDDMNIKN